MHFKAMTQTRSLGKPSSQVLPFRPSAVKSVSPKPRSQNHQARAMECAAVILLNVTLSAIAIVSLVKLGQFQMSQKGQLQDVEQAVTQMDSNVNSLKDKFYQAFDSGQSQSALLRQKGLISPSQRPIKFSEEPRN